MQDPPRRPPEGRRARRHRETRAALLDAALALLRERGIYGTRVEDITTRADVGKGVFYNYFDSKEALVAQLVSAGAEALERDYLHELARAESLDDRVEVIARGQEAFFADHPEFAIAFHQARGLLLIAGEPAQELQAAFSDYLQRLSQHLSRTEEPTDLDADDRLDIAAAIVGAATGYRSFCIAIGRPIRVETISATLRGGIAAVLASRRRKRKSTAKPRPGRTRPK
jgi:AcrR family transcriptional regulator